MATATVSTRPYTNEHVTIRSANAFAETQTKLHRLVPRIDDGIFTLLRYGETERALRELEAAANLSIFSFRDHGALLAIVGQKRQSIQYDIGNPLTASKMTAINSPQAPMRPSASCCARTAKAPRSSTTGPRPHSGNSAIRKSTLSRCSSTRTCRRCWWLRRPKILEPGATADVRFGETRCRIAWRWKQSNEKFSPP